MTWQTSWLCFENHTLAQIKCSLNDWTFSVLFPFYPSGNCAREPDYQRCALTQSVSQLHGHGCGSESTQSAFS